MKSLCVFVILLIIPFSSYTQTTFSKVFNKINGNEFSGGLVYKDNKYFIGGKGVKNPNTGNSIYMDYVLTIDSSLNEKSFIPLYDFFSAPNNASTIINDTIYHYGNNSNGIYNKWKILRYDLDGILLDSIVFNDFNENDTTVLYYAGAMTSKGEYLYLGGSTGGKYDYSLREDLIVIKTDLKGNKIKEERFYDFANMKFSNIIHNMIKTYDDNFAISTSSNIEGEGDVQAGICKFDSNLNIIWTKIFPHTVDFTSPTSSPLITPTQDSGLVMIWSWNEFYWNPLEYPQYIGYEGYPTIFYKLDKDGIIQWTDTLFIKKYPEYHVGPRLSLNTSLTTKSGDIIVAGSYQHPIVKPKERAFILCYSPDGVLKWRHFYINPEFPKGNNYILDIEEAGNGDLVCAGEQYNPNGEFNNNYYTYLFRVDSNGCFTPGCELADTVTEVLLDNNEIYFDEVEKLNLHPNPVHDIINIDLPKDISWKSMSVLNISGKSILTKLITNQNIQSIDISNLDSGLYFIRLLGDNIGRGKMAIGKFVIE